MVRLFLSLLLFCILLPGLLSSCASRISGIMPKIATLQEARSYLGEPARSTSTSDGRVFHTWLLDHSVFEPGQYITQQIYVGHDRDGYRKYIEREVWVPAHRAGKYCRVSIVTDMDGKVVQSSWEGNACDALLKNGHQ